MTHLAVFIHVLFFNLLWLKLFGKERYLMMFDYSYAKWIAVYAWIYNFWGIANLIKFIYETY